MRFALPPPGAFACLVALLFTFRAVAAAPLPGSPNLRYYYPVPAANPPQTIKVDVCVYGGTPGGVAAAAQAMRMGKTAALVVFRQHVGGMTSGGLTATDVGNQGAIGGFAREFYDRVGKLRGFKPSEAENVFRALLDEAGVKVYFEHRLANVEKDGNRITAITMENGNTFQARMYVDATYEGDLFAKSGVSYHVGREGNAKYGETINGVQFHKGHNFTVPTDPYRIEGDPKSGLLWGISPEAPGKMGDADKKVQAYNFRMFLTDAPNRIPWPKPAGYERERYELSARYLPKNPTPPFQLHNGDCNNEGAFSTDNIGRNYEWPEGDYQTREKIFQDHVLYQQGLAWFAANDEAVPPQTREKVRAWGLDPGEFPDTAGWPHELYIREGRRMVSPYVMTEHDCMGHVKAEDSIGLASYNMDSHNCQRIVIDGQVRNEGDVQIHPPMPYPVSYRSIVPAESECANLFVPVSLSASHIAYGSIRMEPVFMILGQSAATAAALAIDANTSVQKVDYSKLRERLLADKQVLVWTGKPAARDGAKGTLEPLPGGIAVDDEKAVRVGEWSESTATRPFFGSGYLTDGNADKGKKSVRFSPEIPAAGTYDVYLCWTALANRATNVPVDIAHAGGKTTVIVNQREKGSWVKVFTGKFDVTGASVTIRNDDTDGYVLADAVCFVSAKN